MNYTLITVAAMVLTVGCSKSTGQSNNSEAQSKSSSATSASDLYETANYKLRLMAPATVSHGKKASFQVVLTTKGDFHINDQYPYRFECSDSADSFSCEKKKLGRSDGTFTKTKAVIPVRFTATRTGEARVGGVYHFSVCSEQNCLMDKKTLSKVLQVD